MHIAHWTYNTGPTPYVALLVAALLLHACSSVGARSPVGATDDLDPLPDWADSSFRACVSGQYMEIAEEIRLLGWQQVNGTYMGIHGEADVDSILVALVWVRLVEHGKTSWSHVVLWGTNRNWHAAVSKEYEPLLEHYDHPPTNADIYGDAFEQISTMTDMTTTIVLAEEIRERTWEAVIGEKPTRSLPISRR